MTVWCLYKEESVRYWGLVGCLYKEILWSRTNEHDKVFVAVSKRMRKVSDELETVAAPMVNTTWDNERERGYLC
jgi:hypothetical protein